MPSKGKESSFLALFKTSNIALVTWSLLLSANKVLTRRAVLVVSFIEGAFSVAYAMLMIAKLCEYMSTGSVSTLFLLIYP